MVGLVTASVCLVASIPRDTAESGGHDFLSLTRERQSSCEGGGEIHVRVEERYM